MDSAILKEKIQMAKEAVKNEEEPFKTEAFKIILNKLLESQKSEHAYSKPQKENTQLKIKKFDLKSNKYGGMTGGVQRLIDESFLNKPRTAREIFDELRREGYYYDLKSIDGILRNNFLRKRTLVRQREGKVWKYVIRK